MGHKGNEVLDGEIHHTVVRGLGFRGTRFHSPSSSLSNNQVPTSSFFQLPELFQGHGLLVIGPGPAFADLICHW